MTFYRIKNSIIKILWRVLSAMSDRKRGLNFGLETSFLRSCECCTVVGSGPSLDGVKWDEYSSTDIFMCNYTPMNRGFKESGQPIKLWSIIDREYTRNLNHDFLSALDVEYKLVASKNYSELPFKCLMHEHFYVVASKYFGASRPALADSSGIYTGNSVPFLIQVAIFLGYKKIYLVGVDHFSTLNLKRLHFDGYEGQQVRHEGITMSKLEVANDMYAYCALLADSRGVEIFNDTPGSYLHVFPNRSAD